MSNEEKDTLRHSCAHIMACAVKRLYPETKFAIGPSIEDGFYYDMESVHKFTETDFVDIEAEMVKITIEDLPFIKREISKAEGEKLFAGQKYKLEILDDLAADAVITVYELGDFVDLCRGPHIERTSSIKADSFKLLAVAGAYWRGDEKREQLQRIYGAVFADGAELQEYLRRREEIEKRDHRRLGRELDLFSFHEEAGQGLAYWHPMGGRVREAIENFWRSRHREHGYELIYTPHVGKSWLWETSGHLDFYREGMYDPMDIDGIDYYVKPMNCPFHIMIYNNDKKSYRDLPCRWAELGTVYRYERSGTLHGMMRVRGFTQDDAHIFCTPDQVESEIARTLDFSLFMLKSFGFTEIKSYLSTRPAKAVGDPERWTHTENALRRALEGAGLSYEVDEGGGAFYGAKIDLKVKDSMGRYWQLSTIQFDFNLPERFNMTFVDKDGVEKRPYMIHRALLGSIERFFGVLVEHFGGAFPVWLAPIQARVVPVAPAFNDYAEEVCSALRRAGLRAEADLSDARMNAKIRKAEADKIPYAFVVGGRDKEAGTASIRLRGGNQKDALALADAVLYVKGKADSLSQEL